jgi:mRNA interferase MazF
VRRGEIWWAQLPEPVGKRPVILASRDEAYEVRRNVTVIEVTTVTRGLATELALGTVDGLPQRCVANADTVNTIDRRYLIERIAMPSSERVRRLDDALRFALALD